mmetsp:Transcript_37095/g.54529  ORF Transcript_37095/g.54529 Transcript_37095/m.54529 type:complete len:582 (-) Transcript_37095:205-1950(-)|eukprot:CAMPEP_0195508246 /NCGR_PEP_ID=MMETSP0794_2-20130614/1507_1 /TAXON_ID=515487 /ORGANISM="Stephanopyxis turris, Strain CCMP 815" /LENGTH=581 /DNA_ID=CAMNT_0040635157 /DNA_START=171 /DNA_END=1916 /DNA_ORIENTATION=+
MSDYSDEDSYHYSDEEMSDNGSNQNEQNSDSDFVFSSDQEPADDKDVAVENEYYNAKGLRETSTSEAAAAFEEVVRMEREMGLSETRNDGDDDPESTVDEQAGGGAYGPWSYKAIKQLVKLHLLRTGNKTEMICQYDRLLKVIISGAVTQNVIEKGVNGILERVSQSVTQPSHYLQQNAPNNSNGSSNSNAMDRMTLKHMYDATLTVFKVNGPCPNERLWFKTNLKLGQLLYEMNETNATSQLQLVIKDLLRSQGAHGADATMADSAGGAPSNNSNTTTQSEQRFAGTHLLEIYALQIQLYSRQKDNKKLRELFERAMRVEGGIPHPRTLALIQELGGKMHMASREFESAGKTFFQAFKSYDEAGDPSRLRCLKYLVMATMLYASSINPFDSQEARPYKDDPEIVAMTNLVQAFHSNEIRKFEDILRRNEGKIMDDEFVREHVADLLRTIRTQVLQSVIAPYTRISLDFIAHELNGIPVEDVESLLVSLILDGKLSGRIDQVGGVLTKGSFKHLGTNAAAAGNEGAAVGGKDAAANVGAAWGSNTLEARNCMAIDQLTRALKHMTTGITNAGGRSAHHQIM